MEIRPARLEDLTAVSQLAAELVRYHHRTDPRRFLLVEPVDQAYRWFFSREIERKGALILVAVPTEPSEAVAGEVLGYSYATLEERNWNDLLDACGKLNDLYVHPGARRLGVGRRLVAESLRWMREAGAPRVVLLSAWQNAEAHKFFEAIGFRRTMVEMTCELAG